MSKIRYKYNPDSLCYVKVEKGIKYYLSRFSIHILSSAVLGVAFFIGYTYILDSPREKRFKRENQQLLTQYELMNKKLDQIENVLNDLQLRDENIYRVIFEADSIPNSIRKAGFGGVNRYEHLEGMANEDLVVNTAKRLDVAMKQLYVQSKSFDEIIGLAKRKDELLRCIPAIMPISNRDLTRTASGWGWRIHPIYKIKKFHEGMDFTATTGTDIYATGEGVVSEVVTDNSGYGKHIVIDHGFGYKSLYAHMSAFTAKPGQKVKRGDVIGRVGSTGTSTAPHLHYEVHLKNKKVNPQFYYFQEDLSAEEYDRMIQISANSNQTFD